MNDQTSFRRIAAITLILAGVLGSAAGVVASLAVDLNFDLLASPEGVLTAGLEPGAINLLRWGEILGVFGYCLLFIPAALYLWFWLSPRTPRMVTLYTVLGLIAIALCVVESGIRASIWPPMMAAYPQAAEVQREMLQVMFGAMSDFAFESLYALNSILAGLWLLGIGLILRSEQRVLGVVTAIMGSGILLAGFGWLTQVDPLARLELLYFLQPFWAVWLGIVIWRRSEQRDHALKPAPAL